MFRAFFLLTFISCEENTPKFSGENNQIVFSSNLKNSKGKWWKGKGPIAVGTHIDISVKELVWMKDQKKKKDPKKRKNLDSMLKQKYKVDDIDALETEIIRKSFIFDTKLQILSMESTEMSIDHLGLVKLTSNRSGKYTIKAKGLEEDRFVLELAQPKSWVLGRSHIGFPFSEKEIVEHDNFCMYPNSNLDFSIILKDKTKRSLAWRLPNFEVHTSKDTLTVEKQKQKVLLKVNKNFVGTELRFDGQNVFRDSLYSDLNTISVCVAGEDSVQGIAAKEVLPAKFDSLSEEDQNDMKKALKQLSKGKSHAFWTKVLYNKGIALSILEIAMDSDVPNLGVPVNLSVEGGIVMDMDTMMQLDRVKKDNAKNMVEMMKQSSEKMKVASGSLLVVLLPDKSQYEVKLNYGKYNQVLMIQPK